MADVPLEKGFRSIPNPNPTTPGAPHNWQPGQTIPAIDPYRAPIDPLDTEDKLAAINERFRDIPALGLPGSWSWQTMQAALDSHTLGIFQGSALLADTMMGDDRIQEALDSRIGALFGCPTVFERAEADTDETVLKAWRQAYPRMGGLSSVEDALAEIKRWRIMLGFGLAEILWDTSTTPWRPVLKPWHPQFTFYDWTARCLVAVTQDGLVPVVPGDGRWFLHGSAYRAWMQGAIRGTAIPWIARNWATRDWIRSSEVHGLPMRIAEVPAMAPAPDKDRFAAGLYASNLGREATIVCPQNVDGTKFNVRLLEATNNSWEVFRGLIERCDTAITLVLKWQTLTTQVKEGSYAAAIVHADIEGGLVEFDNETLRHDLWQQVARPFAAWNFGDAAKAPNTYHNTRAQEVANLEAQERSTRASTAAAMKGAGVFTINEIRQSMGMPPIAGGDRLPDTKDPTP